MSPARCENPRDFPPGLHFAQEFDISRRQTHHRGMVKIMAKVVDSDAVILDAALMDLAHLKTGDYVNVEVHAGGTITLTPIRPRPSREQVSKTIKSTMKDYARTMKRLQIDEAGANTVEPLCRSIRSKKAGATAARLVRKNSELFRRLA